MGEDEFDTMIRDITRGRPAAAGHRVRDFAAGTVLWLLVVIELRVLLLLWHVH